MPSEMPAPVSPVVWGESLSGRPILDRSIKAFVPGLVRRWQSIAPDIDQFALDQHFVSIHLGGAKRLVRRGEGGMQSRDVASGAYSVVPAGTAFRWETHGPIDFAHIYFTEAALNRVIGETFDRDPARVCLGAALGADDPLVSVLASSLLDEMGGGDGDCAYLDDLMHLLLCRITRLHSNVATTSDRAPHALAPFRLRRATDFIEENLATQIGVADIAAATGVSVYHFSRAFRQATGRPPYTYLLDRRVGRAKTLLVSDDRALTDIARQCGFTSLSQFSRAFRRHSGVTPTGFRNRY